MGRKDRDHGRRTLSEKDHLSLLRKVHDPLTIFLGCSFSIARFDGYEMLMREGGGKAFLEYVYFLS